MVTMTDNAVKQLKQIVQKQGTDDVALRVYVSPG